MKISPVNTINSNISYKGFFGKSVVEKKMIGNCKIIDAAKKYYPHADETMADLTRITKNNDKYNTATHSDGTVYKFYSTVKIGETLPCTAKEYELYKAANLANGMSEKESAIHKFLTEHELLTYINETAADVPAK